MLFPDHDNGRIPIVSVTGTNGKTTVARMIGHTLAAAGYTVGLTTTDGIYIGGRVAAAGDMTGQRSAAAVLCDPRVDAAVLETARGGIVKRGLGYDWSDVGVITNIGEDHIGQDGIESIADIVHIKSLVAECVREGGALVLNADDQEVMSIAESERVTNIPRRAMFFSLYPRHLRISRHVASGGTAYYPKDGWIVEDCGATRQQVARIGSLPSTMRGTAPFNLANVLAAVAAARAVGIELPQIAAALRDFRPDLHNPGRANLLRLNGGYVLVDYGHNAGAFQAIGRMASRWHGRRVTGVIGAPGDRADHVIAAAGRSAGQVFDRIIIREDHDLRGRRPGEVAQLLCDAATAAVPGRECRIVGNTREAFFTAVSTMQPGEVVVVFYEELHEVMELVHEYGAEPAAGVEELARGRDADVAPQWHVGVE